MTSVVRQNRGASLLQAFTLGGLLDSPAGPSRQGPPARHDCVPRNRRIPNKKGLAVNAASDTRKWTSRNESASRLWRDMQGLLGRCWDKWRKFRADARSAEELGRMSERALRDIGLEPHQVRLYARGRFPLAASTHEFSAVVRASIFE